MFSFGCFHDTTFVNCKQMYNGSVIDKQACNEGAGGRLLRVGACTQNARSCKGLKWGGAI